MKSKDILKELDIISRKIDCFREDVRILGLVLYHQHQRIIQMEVRTMALVDDVLAEAERGTSIGDSVLALVQKLVDQSGGDPIKLQAIVDSLKFNNDRLEAAVLANTPQEPTPEPIA